MAQGGIDNYYWGEGKEKKGDAWSKKGQKTGRRRKKLRKCILKWKLKKGEWISAQCIMRSL